MTYTSALTENNASSVDSASIAASAPSAILSSLRTPPSTPTHAATSEIADDSAKVSLAGAMLSQAANGSDVRFEKVAALRQSIEAGTYSAPASAVADNLIKALQT